MARTYRLYPDPHVFRALGRQHNVKFCEDDEAGQRSSGLKQTLKTEPDISHSHFPPVRSSGWLAGGFRVGLPAIRLRLGQKSETSIPATGTHFQPIGSWSQRPGASPQIASSAKIHRIQFKARNMSSRFAPAG
jgi:hypothetical protein